MIIFFLFLFILLLILIDQKSIIFEGVRPIDADYVLRCLQKIV